MKQRIESVLEWSFRILLLALVAAMIAFYFKMIVYSQSARLLAENGMLRAELEEAKQALQERTDR